MTDARGPWGWSCPLCEREELKALGHYRFRQLTMDDILAHIMWCADPDAPLHHDEAYPPF